MKKESQFQSELIKELKVMFPGCIVVKNDPNYIQGVPDLTVFYGKHWATIECKRTEKSSHRPNQDYYVEMMDKMSYSRFISPDNKKEVLDELQQTFSGA